MSVSARTCLNMVIGYPLGHSQSPHLHNVCYEALGLDAVLLAFPSQTLPPLIDAMRTLSVGMAAVTMPFKEKIFDFLDEVSLEAKILGAANTVIRRERRLCGYNTDIDGISWALQGAKLSGDIALILGAGGAARAAGYVLSQKGMRILWLARTRKRAANLAKLFGGEAIEEHRLGELHPHLIVNATPVGMEPEAGHSPLPGYIFSTDQTIFDMIYRPLETRLLREARQAGAQAISGLEMFIGQGLRQIELWSGQDIGRPDLAGKIRRSLMSQE